MAYAKETFNYGIPYISNNEILDGTDQEIAAEIIDNQLRAGILGAGGTRVFQDGTYTAVIVDDVTGMVELTLSSSASGEPSVQGIANSGLVEIYDPIVWTGLAANSFYYIYLQAIDSTYTDPTSVYIIASTTQITQNDYLFLATVDTTNTDGSQSIPSGTPSQPVVDSSPLYKPTTVNLFDFLNSGHDPFGHALTQTILTVISQFSVLLDAGTTTLFQQSDPDATLPVITIENQSTQPDIMVKGHINGDPKPMLLADLIIPNGFPLSDPNDTAGFSGSHYVGLAISIMGALNENVQGLIDHINDDTDPHGTTLFQTNLVLSGVLNTVKLLLTPPPPAPPGPPGPPLPPGQLAYLDIESDGELRVGDIRGGLAWSDTDNPYYNGSAVSLMGALNDLLSSITTLSDLVSGLTGQTQAGLSPIVFEISPEELGLPLHFRLTVGETQDFSTVVVTKESKTSQIGWFYEYQSPPVSPPLPPGPPAPPPPPLNPYSLPGAIAVPDPLPLPYWVVVPSGGIPAVYQRLLDGSPVRVKYEPQTTDNLYCRVMYSIAVQEYNGEYGDADLSSVVFD